MATFLDISILTHFSAVFTFLLVFVVVYGILGLINIFGDGNKGLHAIIALCIAFLVLMTGDLIVVLQTFAPWFVLVIFLIFFLLFAVKMFGVSNADITSTFKADTSIIVWIIIFTVLILLFSLGAGFGQKSLETGQGGKVVTNTTVSAGAVATGDFNTNLYNTLYHPKVLGLILVMLIVILALIFLTKPVS